MKAFRTFQNGLKFQQRNTSLQDSLKLCLLTDIKDQPIEKYKSFLKEAIKGGVTMVQLREKEPNLIKLKKLALELKPFLHEHNVKFIINDFPELAAEIDADGVHLGQNDMCPIEARKILGPDKIIGLSFESLDQLIAGNDFPIDYGTLSAIKPSKIKPDCIKIWEEEGMENIPGIIQLSKHPITAIGGIKLSNVREVLETGIDGIAVIGAIHDSQNPYLAARNLKYALDCKLNKSNHSTQIG